MYHRQLIHEVGLIVITYSEPFSVDDLLEQARSIPAPRTDRGGHRCILADFRAVDVNAITAVGSRQYALLRSKNIYPSQGEPAAILVSKDEDFAIFRMHNQWVEASGLRSEEDTFVTRDVDAALRWLSSKTGQPGLERMVWRDADEN